MAYVARLSTGTEISAEGFETGENGVELVGDGGELLAFVPFGRLEYVYDEEAQVYESDGTTRIRS